MIAIFFPQVNLELAKDQSEYQTLPVYVETKEMLVTDPDNPEKPAELQTVPWEMTACFQLNEAEIEEIIRTKKLWYTQCLFGQKFQPVRMSTRNPF